MMNPHDTHYKLVRARLSHLANAVLRRWHRNCCERRPPTFRMTPHFLLERKTLLIPARLILLAGAILRPLSFVLLLRGRRFITVFVAGFLAGALVRQLAARCLGTRGRLWHTRWGAPIFLLIALVAVNMVVHAADRLAFRVFGAGPFLFSSTAAYVLVTLELIWIAVSR